ncbi:MAG: C4-dicarboxylate TRAP transporter substrate-binding protein [Planctomycetota bacterium]|jgi:tripartite ATP-independent transporter DctP family solute receptor|nr:C4-dicarboxylate TRAP transporter substrate-binding protein [Planctomycetota bacterium]
MIRGFSLILLSLLALAMAAPVAGAAQYVVKIGYENHPGEPLDAAVRHWKKLAEEKTGGKLEVQLFPSSQLGSKKDLIEQIRMGGNLVTFVDGSFLADFVPDMAILNGPYLADEMMDIVKLPESDWWKGLEKQLEAKDLHILAFNFLYGIRNMVVKKPVHAPADLNGLKIRVPNNKIQLEGILAMGAIPTPMPLAEVYPALTQGVIDGAENPIPVLYGQKHHEAAKYLILTKHLDNITGFVANPDFLKELPPEIVKAFEEAAYEAGEFSQKLALDADREYTEKIKAEGGVIIEVDITPFQEATKVVYSKFPEWTPGLYEKVRGIMYGGK